MIFFKIILGIIGFIGTFLTILGFMGYSYQDFKSKELIVYAKVNKHIYLNKFDDYQEISFSIKNKFNLIKEKSISIYLEKKEENDLYLIAEYFDKMNNNINISKLLNGFKLDLILFKTDQEYKFSIIVPLHYSYNDFKVKGDVGDNIFLVNEIYEYNDNLNYIYIIVGLTITIISSIFFYLILRSKLNSSEKKYIIELNNINEKVLAEKKQYNEKESIYKNMIDDKNEEIKKLYKKNERLEKDNKEYVDNLKKQLFAFQEKFLENIGR